MTQQEPRLRFGMLGPLAAWDGTLVLLQVKTLAVTR